jgi:hypothetical protein
VHLTNYSVRGLFFTALFLWLAPGVALQECHAGQQDSITASMPLQVQSEGTPAAGSIDIQVQQAIQQWKNASIRQVIQHPAVYNILSYTRSIFRDSTVDRILAHRCTTSARKLPLADRKTLYALACSTSSDVKKPPRQKARGKSYFTDSTVVFLLRGVYFNQEQSNLIDVYSDRILPLQDWFTFLSSSDPAMSASTEIPTSSYYDRNEYPGRTIFSAEYKNPVFAGLLLQNELCVPKIANLTWEFSGRASFIVPTEPMPAYLIRKKAPRVDISGLILSKDSIPSGIYELSETENYNWEADVNRDSIPDVRVITYPKPESNNEKINIFAQVNIRGKWVTTDYYMMDNRSGY